MRALASLFTGPVMETVRAQIPRLAYLLGDLIQSWIFILRSCTYTSSIWSFIKFYAEIVKWGFDSESKLIHVLSPKMTLDSSHFVMELEHLLFTLHAHLACMLHTHVTCRYICTFLPSYMYLDMHTLLGHYMLLYMKYTSSVFLSEFWNSSCPILSCLLAVLVLLCGRAIHCSTAIADLTN